MNAQEMTIWACMMRSCRLQLSEGECLIRHQASHEGIMVGFPQDVISDSYILSSQLRADHMPGPPREGQLMCCICK